MKLLGIMSVDFDVRGHLLITFFCICQILEKKWDYNETGHLLITFFCICQILEKKWDYNETEHQLFIDFNKAYDSARREGLYNILIEFGVTMNQVTLIKMCLNETYSKVDIGKYLSDNFPIQNGLKKEMLYSHSFSTFL
jgi:hypothetical protein